MTLNKDDIDDIETLDGALPLPLLHVKVLWLLVQCKT